MEMFKVSEAVTQLTPRVFSSNSYVLAGKEPAVIDPGCGDPAGLTSALKALGVETKGVKRVFYTHMHYDHWGHWDLFHGAEHLMHEADAAFLEAKSEEHAALEFFNPESFEFPRITTKLKGGEEFDVNGLRLIAIHAPGHTPGSTCFFMEKEKILFSGDVIFQHGGIGRYDLPGGDYETQMGTVEKMRALPWETLCAGHMAIEKRKTQ
ncbi:MAG TPA: MBL fold metallo-hydrolase [archaeon]|nr:MBL fold metallo-hydrolase [archaeon]